ncbi:MAG: hypothetical protein U1F36_02675 [Planctomycetota bacterium]
MRGFGSLLVLAGWLCAVPVHAQGAALPARLFGVVQLHDGSPWVDATVFLCEDQVDDELPPRAGRMRSSPCDAQGRFAFEVPRGRGFRVWAEEQVELGRARASQDVIVAQSGERVVLCADPVLREPTVLRVLGEMDGFARPLQLESIEQATRRVMVWSVPADGVLRLPARIGGSVLCTLRDGHDALIASVTLGDDDREIGLHLPGRVPRRLRFFDAVTRAPLSGIRVETEFEVHGRVLGVSDAKGEVEIVPVVRAALREGAVEVAPMRLFAVGPGRMPFELRLGDGPEDTFTLPQPSATAGAIRLVAARRELAAVRAVARVRFAEPSAQGTKEGIRRYDTRCIETDDVGRILFDAPVGSHVDLSLACDEVMRACLPMAWRDSVPPRISLPLDVGSVAQVVDLVERVRPLDIGLLAPDGTPLADAEVGLAPDGGSVTQSMRADRAGVVRVFLPIGSEPSLLLATGAQSIGAVWLSPAGKPKDPLAVERRNVTLLPARRVSVRLDAGLWPSLPLAPLAHAQWFSDDRVKREELLTPKLDAATNAVAMVCDADETLRHFPKFGMHPRIVQDAFELFVPRGTGHLDLRVRARVGARVVWARGKVESTKGEGPIVKSLSFGK